MTAVRGVRAAVARAVAYAAFATLASAAPPARAAIPASASVSAPASAPTSAESPLLLQRQLCEAAGSSHAEYFERSRRQWLADAEAAQAKGLWLRPLEQYEAALPDRAEYALRKAARGIVCERLVYRSEGLRVVAYLWRPAKGSRSGAGVPLIIFNRGGFGEDFKLRPNTWFGFHRYVAAGYAVLGSQYRGNDGGEGRDELGAGDVRDVMNLFPLARELGGIDVSRAYLLGFSRGGLVTLMALQRAAPVRAAAVLGAPAELRAESDGARRALAARIPDFDADPERALRERSPIHFIAAFRTPLLILHGGGDALVDPTGATRLAAERLRAGRPVELVVYEGDTHGVALNGRDRDRRVIEWFARH